MSNYSKIYTFILLNTLLFSCKVKEDISRYAPTEKYPVDVTLNSINNKKAMIVMFAIHYAHFVGYKVGVGLRRSFINSFYEILGPIQKYKSYEWKIIKTSSRQDDEVSCCTTSESSGLFT